MKLQCPEDGGGRLDMVWQKALGLEEVQFWDPDEVFGREIGNAGESFPQVDCQCVGRQEQDAGSTTVQLTLR